MRKNIGLGLAGFLNFNAEAGFFPNRKRVFLQDFQHFNGNRILLTRPPLALNAFYLLPYYRFSTTDAFARAHFEHHLEGFLLDKIPLLRKTGWQTVFSANYLHTPDAGHYLELALGLENLGWKAFRFLRLDYAVALHRGRRFDWGLKLGVDLQQ